MPTSNFKKITTTETTTIDLQTVVVTTRSPAPLKREETIGVQWAQIDVAYSCTHSAGKKPTAHGQINMPTSNFKKLTTMNTTTNDLHTVGVATRNPTPLQDGGTDGRAVVTNRCRVLLYP